MKTKIFHSFILLVSMMMIGSTGWSQSIILTSPDGRVTATVIPGHTVSNIIHYDLSYGKTRILHQSSVGLDLAGFSQTDSLQLTDVRHTSRFQIWKTVYGERKYIPQKYKGVVLTFRTANKRNPRYFKIVMRAYNEGLAFKYRISDDHSGDKIVVNKELSDFAFSGDYPAWVTTMAQGLYFRRKISEITKAVERPLTVKVSDSVFVALGEAALVNYARMKFVEKDSTTLQSHLYGKVSGRLPLTSPWRYILTGDSPGDLLEKNYLLLDLNEPNKITDTRWIRPGKVIREVTLTTKGALACVDFAAAHNLQYIEFDAGWYGYEYSDTSDATHVSVDPKRSKGPLDLKRIIGYAHSKNIGVILYVNRRALERQLDTLLPLYHSWGVKGMKFGFVRVGSQRWTNWLHSAVRKAARYHIMVDVHDEYRPTGYSRTYPNFMTQEGVRGDEEAPSNKQTLITLFTRMIAGAADHTVCYFTKRATEKVSSHATQLAKAVCLYSPWQFLYWYDRPGTKAERDANKEGIIQPVPELSFFDKIPTVWDETRVLEGKIGAYATIARRSGEQWFVGSINGIQKREMKLTCTFLDENKEYKAIIYTDDNRVPTPTKVKKTVRMINHNSVLSFSLLPNNGMAMRIFPVK